MFFGTAAPWFGRTVNLHDLTLLKTAIGFLQPGLNVHHVCASFD